MSDTNENGAASGGAVAALTDRFPDADFGVTRGQDVVRIDREELVAFVGAAREAGFDMFIDLTAVDYLSRRPHRFELVIGLLATAEPARLRIHVGIPGSDPVAPSISGVYPGANFFEREVYDMFGIGFEGHPDLTRILMPDEWVGHPLRKDYPVGSVPVQFKEANRAR